jgi:hypothetical protein
MRKGEEDMFEDQAPLSVGGTDTPDQEKSTASKNALIHGVYAREIILPGESEERFTELYSALRSDLNPESPLEEEAVLDIVRFHWLKRRAIKAAKGEFQEGKLLMNVGDMLDRVKSGSFRTEPIEPTYQPADLERVIKLEAMIDSRIEKALARLAGIKEFRRLYGQKTAIEVKK